MDRWRVEDSETLYNVGNWGGGFFRINERGNVTVCPDGDATGEGAAGARGIDLRELVGQLSRRGVRAPLLLRFDGILRSRLRQISAAFDRARAEFEYENSYTCVFPVKVNQQRHLVDAFLQEKVGMGIEVGSKPELLAVMALYADEGRLVVCNGYKDRDYVETALSTRKLGARPILVVEKFTELRTILDAARDLDIEPIIGVRTKLSGAGSGRWRDSAGDRSKFGLTTRQIVDVVETLEAEGKLGCLRLLHFHLGSQITHIRSVKDALREALQTYVGLHQMGAPIEWFDVGGGLGIDYDGSSTNFDSSMNYTLQEYANDVVYQTKEACAAAEVPQPTLLSESGRALAAHHAVLVTEVLGVSDFSGIGVPSKPVDDEPEIVHEFAEVCEAVNGKNYQESYHDALQLRDTGMTLFQVGQIDLRGRARVEEYFWRTCEKILRITRTLDYVPEDLEGLERSMADTYFLNFSVFQSMPDSWAIRQLFPVLPLHRHDEEPTRRAVLADITCDSDGKVDRFISLRDVKSVLELHPWKRSEPYYLGFFLVGAYQEILGDLHNLFGDTNVVHVDLDRDGVPRLKHVVPGDKVEEVLSYVEYFSGDLLRSLRHNIERALEADRLSFEDSAALLERFERGMASYTYLSSTSETSGSPSVPEKSGPEGGDAR